MSDRRESLTTREKWLLGAVIFFAASFIGSLVTFAMNREVQVWPALSAVGTIIGVSVAFRALETSRKSLIESQSANKRAYDTFALDYRPWLSAELAINARMNIASVNDEEIWLFSGTLKVLNHGKRPATNVQVYTTLVAFDNTKPQGQQMREFSRDYMKHDNNIGPVIFPNGSHEFKSIGGSIFRAQATKVVSNGWSGVPMVVGCVVYDGAATNERVQTRFAFFLDSNNKTNLSVLLQHWPSGSWVVRLPGFLEID